MLFFNIYLGDDEPFGLIDLFDFDIEGNIPTLYSAVSVLFCSALHASARYQAVSETGLVSHDYCHFGGPKQIKLRASDSLTTCDMYQKL